jgi:hypothetical protein
MWRVKDMARAFCGLVWLSIMLVLALWGTTGAVEEVQLVYVGSTTSSVWHGLEQGLREANVLGSYTGYTYTVELEKQSSCLALSM